MPQYCATYDHTLSEFVKEHGRENACELLGLTYSGLSNMINSNRIILVKVDHKTPARRKACHYIEFKAEKRGTT